LHASPSIVQPSDRLRECRECGSLGRPHECPFTIGYRSTLARPSMQPQVATAPRPSFPATGGLVGPSTSAAALAVAIDDLMCSEWRKKKTCGRLTANLTCNCQHSADFVVSPQVCFDFANGRCTRVKCIFAHSSASNSAYASARVPTAARTSAPPARPLRPPSLLSMLLPLRRHHH
jgi:hypothetical protein